MAAEEPASGQRDAVTGPVPPDRLLGVDAAARPEAAVTSDEGRERDTVGLNEEQEGLLRPPRPAGSGGSSVGAHGPPRPDRSPRSLRGPPARDRPRGCGLGRAGGSSRAEADGLGSAPPRPRRVGSQRGRGGRDRDGSARPGAGRAVRRAVCPAGTRRRSRRLAAGASGAGSASPCPPSVRGLRARSACGPSGVGASGRAAHPSSASGPGSRAFASVGGCSAGTSSSLLIPIRRGLAALPKARWTNSRD